MIRRMRREDLEQAAELEKLCFSESWSYSLLEAGLSGPWDEYYVLEQDGRILGYSNLRILAGEGEIERICVHPLFRRRGAARQLMEAMQSSAAAQGVTAVTLEVRESNLAARRLYESFGFVAEAVRKNYYRNPAEDAVIMWRRRTPETEADLRFFDRNYHAEKGKTGL